MNDRMRYSSMTLSTPSWSRNASMVSVSAATRAIAARMRSHSGCSKWSETRRDRASGFGSRETDVGSRLVLSTFLSHRLHQHFETSRCNRGIIDRPSADHTRAFAGAPIP